MEIEVWVLARDRVVVELVRVSAELEVRLTANGLRAAWLCSQTGRVLARVAPGIA